MLLSHRAYGKKPGQPLVILHGLMGSSRNWLTVSRDLEEERPVICLDLRNHGDSQWADDCSHAAMADDVRETLQALGVETYDLLGHSLGGKVAMRLAVDDTNLEKLIVVDIAPRSNPPLNHAHLIAMRSLDLEAIESRKDADEQLADRVRDWAHRQFLLTNLDRTPRGFQWSVNLEVLIEKQDDLRAAPLAEGEIWEGRCLFIVGEKSAFIREEDFAVIEEFFPNVVFETLPTGHNPHIEKREVLVATIRAFLP